MRARTWLFATIVPSLGLALGWATTGESCPVIETLDSAEISVQLTPTENRTVRVALYEGEEAPYCTASVSVPLSAFPTTRLATRPVDVARSLRDVVAEWKTKRCSVFVQYENDTREEIEPHELCWVEIFSFDGQRPRSASRESTCWEPDDLET